MSTILFISEAYLKQFTVINDNVDPKLIRPAIRRAMDKYIQPALGTNLYRTIETNIETSSGGMSANNYKSLVDTYIMPAMAHWTMYELRYDMVFRWRNKGIMSQSSDNGTPVTFEDAEKLGNVYKSDAEFYTARLVDYLCYNDELFPEYNNNNDEQIQSQKSNYNFGWYLGQYNDECSEDMS